MGPSYLAHSRVMIFKMLIYVHKITNCFSGLSKTTGRFHFPCSLSLGATPEKQSFTPDPLSFSTQLQSSFQPSYKREDIHSSRRGGEDKLSKLHLPFIRKLLPKAHTVCRDKSVTILPLSIVRCTHVIAVCDHSVCVYAAAGYLCS